MSVLAHVFEAAGIATVTLSSVRAMAEKVTPPRALHCQFPLGRPLGKPNDPDFQHDVLARAFALLDEPAGPVLVDHPDTIPDAEDQPLSCSLPPRYDPDVPAAVDEARGVRKAYDRVLERRGATSVGRVVDADGVPEALEVFHRIAEGAPWGGAGIPGDIPIAVCHDIRTYYEEAAIDLADTPDPGGRQIESWFFDQTEAGRTIMAARQAIADQGAAFPIWFYMSPGQR